MRTILITALALTLVPAGIYAQSKRKRPKASVGVFVFPKEGRLSRARQATLQITMENALKQNERLTVVDKDRRLAIRAGEVPKAKLADAQRLLDQGASLVAKGKGKDALGPLKKAEKVLRKTLAHVSKRTLARAQFLIGVAYTVMGKDKSARQWFGKLQVWRPAFKPNAPIKQKQVKKLWRAAGKELADTGKGALELVTEPSGALAYVDGQPVGFTPTYIEDLTPGTHYITFAMNGYARTVVPGKVSKDSERKLSTKLKPSTKVVQMTALARAITASMDEEDAPNALVDLGKMLSIDQVIFVEVPSSSAANPSYRAAVFDTKTRKRLSTVTTPLEEDQDLEELFENVARSLYAEIVITKTTGSEGGGTSTGPDASVTKRGNGKPIYKQWWFWTGVAVAATAAVAVPLAVTSGDDGGGDACPGGSVCGEVIWGVRF